MTRYRIFLLLMVAANSLHGQTRRGSDMLTSAEQKMEIELVRESARGYTRRLPNYTCTQTTKESVRPTAVRSQGLRVTVVEEQLSLLDGKEVRRITKVDGRPVSAGTHELPPGMSRGEFGSLLAVIFDPGKGAQVRWDRAATLNRRAVQVFAFHVPQSSGYVLTEPKRLTQVPFEGFVYADAQTHEVVRIQMKCVMIPADSQYHALDLTLDFRAAPVAGKEFILPSRFELNFRTDEVAETNIGEYTSYRRFGADATIHFEE